MGQLPVILLLVAPLFPCAFIPVANVSPIALLSTKYSSQSRRRGVPRAIQTWHCPSHEQRDVGMEYIPIRTLSEHCCSQAVIPVLRCPYQST
ncbi:uncharacterized protein BDZ83DRAFT_628653 [Colletotrichum acutatum]|uniref:Secreted protein n=1 Tax=Glomerella acutata TaxID=27357 RepID=A0AAD8XF71_GLOAC|nr:uncharacterized protein BDZ83DRAFT_628653 [Colletotrichum acutatum]KAK1722563.1 hypothetical protein BDZ83DRAFT_628653 [Colletotrichum acutatum]